MSRPPFIEKHSNAVMEKEEKKLEFLSLTWCLNSVRFLFPLGIVVNSLAGVLYEDVPILCHRISTVLRDVLTSVGRALD